jgi:nucleoside-diphosphate-sugar epimerase
LTDETALVTGAGGFLGTCLMSRLAATGVRAIGSSRRPPAPGSVPADAEWRLCDVEDAEAVQRLVREVRPTTVFHLASQVRGTRELAAVLPMFRANLASTVYLLAAASEAGCRRVVLAASMEELPVDQPARFPYAIAKRAATEYGRFFQNTYGLSVVSARIGMAYGAGQRDIAKLVPHVILSQLEGKAPRLASGSRRADWTYVEDVADAFIACMNVESVEGTVVEIGTGEGTSVGDIAERLAAITGGPRPEIGALADRSNDCDVVADADTTARLIGWRARVSLDEGLRRSVEWYRTERAAGRL